MNSSGYKELFTGSVSGVGTTGANLLVTLPHTPPAEGDMVQIALRETTTLSTEARCEVYQDNGGDKIATYEDPDTPGDMIAIDDTWETFAFSDPGVGYTRGSGGTFTIYVETNDATDSSTVEARVWIRGRG